MSATSEAGHPRTAGCRRLFLRLKAAQLCATLAMCSLASPVATVAQQDRAVVTTYAGSGQLGMADGDVKTATFMLPAGLADAGDGTLYVSDEGAERIRAIANGRVTTVAGSGDPDVLGLSVPGGYLDGPALAAKFDHPLGMTVGPGGALYIADSKNAAIRMLKNGVVSTVIGHPGSTAPIDGDAGSARLVNPRSLAFDRAGRLWIADYKGGLRCWDRGRLTTIPLKLGVTDVLSVSVQPDDGSIVVATSSLLITIAPAGEATAAVVAGDRLGARAIEEGDNEFGTPSTIAAVGHVRSCLPICWQTIFATCVFRCPPSSSHLFRERSPEARSSDGPATRALPMATRTQLDFPLRAGSS